MIKRVTQIGVTLVLQGAALFLSAGSLAWLWGWVYLGLYLAGIGINAWLMLRLNREAIALRAETSGMKDWDKVIGGLWGLLFFLVIPIVSGLDVRFHWTETFSLAAHLGGAVLFSFGLALFSWAMVSNAYFSTVVRVLDGNRQPVSTTGLYRLVRHPGYTGGIAMCLGLPLLLGSAWALIPGTVAVLLMILRTVLEDRTLQAELEGYQDYRRQVHFKLIPRVW